MQVGMMLTIIGKYSASKKAITASDLKLKNLKENFWNNTSIFFKRKDSLKKVFRVMSIKHLIFIKDILLILFLYIYVKNII